jgi:hypothetical protein
MEGVKWSDDIESEAAKMWKESCQRAVGVKDKEGMMGKRNVRVILEKVETLRRTAVINVKKGRLRFEEEVKRVFREKGYSLGSREAKNLKLKLEGEPVKALEEDKKMKEAKVAHLRKKYGGMERVKGGGKNDEDDKKLIEGVKWSDEDLSGMEEDGVRREDLVEAGVTLDDDEWEVIRLPPKVAMYEKLDRMKMKMDMEEANAKQRWGRIKLGT